MNKFLLAAILFLFTGSAFAEGDTLKLAGIEFKILHSTDGEGYNIEIPALNAIYRHMLGAKTHSILRSKDYIKAEISDLKNYQAKKYNLVLTSHNAPEGQDAVSEKIAYLEKILAFANSSRNGFEFARKVKAEFPDYAGEIYLTMSSSSLFPFPSK